MFFSTCDTEKVEKPEVVPWKDFFLSESPKQKTRNRTLLSCRAKFSLESETFARDPACKMTEKSGKYKQKQVKNLVSRKPRNTFAK